MPSVVDSIGSLISSIFGAITSVLSGILGLFQNFFNIILGVIQTAFSAVGTAATGLVQTFEGLLKFLLSEFSENIPLRIVGINRFADEFRQYSGYWTVDRRCIHI